MPNEMTSEERIAFEIWVTYVVSQTGSGPIGWLYQQVPGHGRYAGNGFNDAWIVWQAYNYVFGDGTAIGRNEAGAAQIQTLMADYIARFGDDPLGIVPTHEGDWNAFFHDIGSMGGFVTQVLNHFTFSLNEITSFLGGADLFHFFSAPFMGVFGTLASAVWAAVDVIGATFDFGWGVMSDFFGTLADAYDHLSQGDFEGALNDLINFGAGVFERLRALADQLVETIFPVVLDLDGDGVELVSIDRGVIFDVDGDGVADRSGWVSADDGILAIDLDGDRVLDGVAEIRFADAAAGFDTDLEGLSRYDLNQDGILDARDEDFDRFLIWQDVNQDGVCDDGEARTLEEAGIAAIRLALNNMSSLQAGNNVYNTTSWIDENGVEREAWDVGFRSGLDQAQSLEFDWGVITGGADGFVITGNGQAIDLSAFLQSALNRAWDDGGSWF